MVVADKPEKQQGGFRIVIRHNSALSIEDQLIGQFKIAVMLGTLQPGNSLPSVRQLEEQTGVGRNVIWRAYSKLAASGSITIQNRRRAVVNSRIQPDEAADLFKMFDWMSRDVLERVQSLGMNPQSFCRFLNHRIHDSDVSEHDIIFVECNRIQARNWSTEISDAWVVPVPGLELSAIRSLTEEERSKIRVALTPLFHHEEVLPLFRNPRTRVIPLHLDWNPERIQEWRALGKRCRMVFVLEKSECLGYGEPFARQLNTLCPNLHIEVVAWKSREHVKHLLKSGRFRCAFLSGPVLEVVDDEIRQSPLVVKRALIVNWQSLEEARIKAGVML